MDNSKIFSEEKQKTLEILKKVKSFLEQGNKFGISIEKELIQKINNGISFTESEKLKVALIGEFSSGKTSILAAWAEVYDSDKILNPQVKSQFMK